MTLNPFSRPPDRGLGHTTLCRHPSKQDPLDSEIVQDQCEGRMVKRGVPGLDDEAVFSPRSDFLDQVVPRLAAPRPFDNAAGIAIKNAGRVIGVDDRRGTMPGCLDQGAEIRESARGNRQARRHRLRVENR